MRRNLRDYGHKTHLSSSARGRGAFCLAGALLLFGSVAATAQTGPASWPSSRPALPSAASAPPKSAAVAPVGRIPLVVPAGTPIRVSLVKKVPIRKVGDPVEARVIEPVYSFDRIVVPAGSEVTGKVVRIIPATKWSHTEAILNGNFTPLKTAQVEFDTLTLINGTQMPIQTSVSPAITEVVRLVSRQPKHPSLVNQAKEAIDQEWKAGMHQIHAPGKLHRLKELLIAQLPYHHQYLAKGTVYDAALRQPLSCGAAKISPGELAHVGQLPPANTIAQARLLTALSSATAHKGTPVKAVITKPVFNARKQLVLPVGTKLEGVVVQAQAARRLHRNGKLRFVIRRMELPSGVVDQIDASIEGLEVSKHQNLALDSEGGTSVKESKKRYLDTALSVAVATASLDLDAGKAARVGNQQGDVGPRAVAGGSGFKLIGLALGAAIQSRVLGASLGFFGAARSVYYHFLSHGRNVVLVKDTPMEIAFGSHAHPSGNY